MTRIFLLKFESFPRRFSPSPSPFHLHFYLPQLHPGLQLHQDLKPHLYFYLHPQYHSILPSCPLAGQGIFSYPPILLLPPESRIRTSRSRSRYGRNHNPAGADQLKLAAALPLRSAKLPADGNRNPARHLRVQAVHSRPYPTERVIRPDSSGRTYSGEHRSFRRALRPAVVAVPALDLRGSPGVLEPLPRRLRLLSRSGRYRSQVRLLPCSLQLVPPRQLRG
jgi:hypothetical protein